MAAIEQLIKDYQRRVLGLFYLCWLGLTLGGCTPATPPATLVAADAATPHGGEVVIVIPEEPSTLNPYLALAPIVRQVADATMAGLTTVNERGEFVPVLAAELPTLANGGVAPDYRTVTWKLRAGLRWSDGHPLTADDVKFTWEAVTHPDSGAVLAVNFDLIEAIDTPDPLTAVIHYKTVNPAYLQQFMHGLLPRHATGAPGDMLNWSWNRQPVTAGPFVLGGWAAGDAIVMERNPHYYLTGQPHLERLVFQIVPDPGAQIALMAQGAAHIQLWPAEMKAVYDQQTGDAAALHQIPGRWNMALRFNLSRPFDDDPGAQPPHPILGDLRVRQAIAHAIDYDTIRTAINPGTAPAIQPFAYGWYTCILSRPYRYNPARAQALLAAAGWIPGADGIRIAQNAPYAPDGARLVLQIESYTDFQPVQALEDALVEQLQAVGIEISIQNDPLPVIFGSYADGSPRMTGNFDLLLYDESLPIDPQSTIANLFHSAAISSTQNTSGANFYRWVNPAADALIQKAGSTVDIATRRAAYCELGRLIATELPQLHLFRFREGYGAARQLRGYKVNMWGSGTWDVQNWQLAMEE
ncbi:MAG: peptide ABC transporter substrate-binding protein [Chloroflexota bacterium]|nr:peptide ABC transporter substrate-binding protein [Chloroflexota bacterium]